MPVLLITGRRVQIKDINQLIGCKFQQEDWGKRIQ